MVEEAGRVVADRLQKLEALREAGVEPYAYRYDVTHSTTAARSMFETAETGGQLDESGESGPVRLGGRLVSLRSHGKTLFADLADREGRIQLYFRSRDLGDRFALLDLFDIGDWVGVEGRVFRTRMGEVTVKVSDFELLAKSVRPLPFGKEEVDPETGERRVHHGFADIEQRYRQRYADLAVHPEVRRVFVLRARIVTTIRRFLDERGFIEVETPILQPLYGGASARPFTTHHNALDMPLYLRIADELYLKRLIVGGFERVYEIGKDFRNEGIDRTHNPEFTMLEAYGTYLDYNDMAVLTQRMYQKAVVAALGTTVVVHDGQEYDLGIPEWPRVTLYGAVSEALGEEITPGTPLEELRRYADKREVHWDPKWGPGKLVQELFEALVEHTLIQPTFVLDYPLETSPLTRQHREDPRLTEKWDLIGFGTELGTAYSELIDPIEQRRRLTEQSLLAAGGDPEAMQLDEDFLRALEYAMPPTGGMGAGIDRMIMAFTGRNIRETILFPLVKPTG